jgi:hypothetical protein
VGTSAAGGGSRWLLLGAGLVIVTGAIIVLSLGDSTRRAAAPGSGHGGGETGGLVFEDGSPRQRPEFEATAARLDREGNVRYFIRRRVQEVRAKLADPSLTAAQRVELSTVYAIGLISEGDTETAVKAIDEAFEIARTIPGLLDRQPDLHWSRALVYLREAEVQNCIRRRNADCCVFPLRGGGVHALRDPAEQARASFARFFDLKPEAPLGARWMLNLMAMALGEYPDALPQDVLIPPQAFASEYDIGRFTDLAPRLGVDRLNLAGGCVVEDLDDDGLLDIVCSTMQVDGPLTLFQNRGSGGFEDRSAESRLDDQLGGLNMVGADYDNDGDVDLLVLRGAWWYEDGRIRNSLLRNNGDGTFSDVTRAAGLADPPMPTQVGVWGDYDNDGDLDVFIGNESRVELEQAGATYPSQLFRNNGDGTFTDIAAAAGVTNDRMCKGASAGDFDNDGDLDLYVSNILKNRLYRNNGNMTFTDVAEELGVTAPEGRSFAAWFFDYNNDGWLDIFCAAYQATIDDLAADLLGLPHQSPPPALYRNDRGRFSNVTAAMGLQHVYLPMGANFGDLDNDGWLDLYLTTGDPKFEALMPNIMLRNDAARRFQDVTQSGGFGYLQKGHGVSFADFDHDGDQDIYHMLGGLYLGDAFHNVFLLNPGHGGRFLTLRLVGVRSNRMAIGARIRVVVETPAGRREIHRAVGSVSSFGGSPFRQEIGLGEATAIARLEITWPRSGTVQVFEHVPLDSFLRVTEGRDRLEQLPAPRIAY